MKENDEIPKLKINKGLVNVNKLFDKLKELEQYVDVGFTEEGLIPEYIEFDRTDKELYIMIEEVLSIYVNEKIEMVREYEEAIIKDLGKEYNSDDELFYVFPMSMFESGSVNKEDTVVDVRKMFGFFINCNKEILSLVSLYDVYHSNTMKLYICELINNKDDKKIRRLYLDAVMELEKMLMEIEETTINLLFKYLDNSYYKLVDNVLRPEYKFDLGLRYTIIKNATELHVFEFIKEKREQINQMLTLEYYKVKKLMKIKNNGDEI